MPVSFARDVAPLFHPSDVSCMAKFGVLLNDYAYMSDPTGNHTYTDHANAREAYSHLIGATAPRMPLGGPFWSDAQLQLFNQWITDGFVA